MIMTESEICMRYHNAAKPKKQVRILAQLNACHDEDIRRILAAHGIETPRPKKRESPYSKICWTPDKREEVRRLVSQGKTYPEIADRFGCSASAVSNIIGRMGLRGIYKPPVTPWRKYRDHTGAENRA